VTIEDEYRVGMGPRPSEAAASMPGSGIRDMMHRIANMDDVINVAPGEPDFPTPAHIVAAGIEALRAGHTNYANNAGLPELRSELVHKLQRHNRVTVDPDRLIVTNGAAEGLYSAFVALVGPGDEVLLPDPGWPNFRMMAMLRNAVIRDYRLSAETGYLPSIAQLETLVSPATRLILLNTPLNPVGSIIGRELMIELVRFAERHNIWVLSDETYDAITYDDSYVSAASLDTSGRVVGVYSFSKTYAMTGWRVGYVAAPPSVAPIIATLQEAMISCVNTPAQWAALAALRGPQEPAEMMRAAYADRRRQALELLGSLGIPVHPPSGAFYLWVDIRGSGVGSDAFAGSLLDEQRVAVAPGSTFGPSGEGFVRIALTSGQRLGEGIARLARHHAALAAARGRGAVPLTD
jgi:aspartate/methionine/tyrosine aminotransferase